MSKINETRKTNGSKVDAQRILQDKNYEQAVQEVKEHLATAPTLDEVRRWVERDLSAAQYSIGAILRHPTLLDTIAKEMHENAQKSPAIIMQEQAERLKPKAEA